VAVGLGVLVLSGCRSSNDAADTGSAITTAPGLAAAVPTGFDPCNDIPQSILDSERLGDKLNANSAASGGVLWRGCQWTGPDSYSAAIRTTNISVNGVLGNHFPETQELTIDGRRAVSSRQFDGPHIKEACTLNVEIKGGGTLEFNIDNPPSTPLTGSIDSCQLARGLANKVVPIVPATA
jgi:hypothetical protein